MFLRTHERFILTIFLFALLPALAAAQQAASLEGTVVQGVTKEPVRKAHVTLELSGEKHDSVLFATTDETGRFRFAEVQPGEYDLTVEKNGFLEGGYGRTKPGDEDSLLKVGEGDGLQNLTLLLFPGGTISGQVLDEDGDPVSEEVVVLWDRRRRRGQPENSHINRTVTNRAGEYRFEELSPGTYFVSANPDPGGWGNSPRQIAVDASGRPSKIHDLTTFYPMALSLADAQSIRIGSGQEQSGIDIHIQRGPTLSVKGRIAGLTGLPSRYSLSATVNEGVGWTSGKGEILANGEFVFKELPPGKHRLTLSESGPNGYKEVGKTAVTLTDQDLMGVVITPFKPAVVQVRVVVEGSEDKPITTGSVFLNPLGGNEDGVGRLMQYMPQNGTFKIENVPPGKYWVWFNNATDCYLKSVESGGQQLDADSIEIGDDAVLDLVMVFSKNVAKLSGDVDQVPDELKHSVQVLALPEKPDEVSELRDTRFGQVDQSLHFSVTKMRPGKYLAFAVQDADLDLWSNPDFVKLLQSEAVEIELHEKEQATVHLKLTTKDKTDAVRKQLGL